MTEKKELTCSNFQIYLQVFSNNINLDWILREPLGVRVLRCRTKSTKILTDKMDVPSTLSCPQGRKDVSVGLSLWNCQTAGLITLMAVAEFPSYCRMRINLTSELLSLGVSNLVPQSTAACVIFSHKYMNSFGFYEVNKIKYCPAVKF